MKIITTTFNVYTYKELKELGNEEAIKNANSNIQERMTDTVYDFYWEEFKNTLKKFAEALGTSIKDYSFELFSHSYVWFDLEEHKDNSNKFKNSAVKELNNSIEKWKNADYTGVYTDSYVSDYLTECYPNGVTYNDLTTIVKQAPHALVKLFQKDSEKEVLDEDSYCEYADDREWHFKEDGEIYFI